MGTTSKQKHNEKEKNYDSTSKLANARQLNLNDAHHIFDKPERSNPKSSSYNPNVMSILDSFNGNKLAAAQAIADAAQKEVNEGRVKSIDPKNSSVVSVSVSVNGYQTLVVGFVDNTGSFSLGTVNKNE